MNINSETVVACCDCRDNNAEYLEAKSLLREYSTWPRALPETGDY